MSSERVLELLAELRPPLMRPLRDPLHRRPVGCPVLLDTLPSYRPPRTEGSAEVIDVHGAAPDEDYYIPVEFVTVTRAIGTRRVIQISRGTAPPRWIAQAQLGGADYEDQCT